MGKNRKPKFHCKNNAQKYAIRKRYAERNAKANNSPKAPPTSKSQDLSIETKPKFQLPLKSGKRIWNIYKVPNRILNGCQDSGIHGGLVLDEENENVMLVEVTHSAKNGKRNNIPVRNLDSTDLDENGKPRDSYVKKKLVVSIAMQDGEQGVDIKALKAQMNDLQFTEEEKKAVLDQLSNLTTAEERYLLFKDLAQKKTDT